jgi:hypothetical protein
VRSSETMGMVEKYVQALRPEWAEWRRVNRHVEYLRELHQMAALPLIDSWNEDGTFELVPPSSMAWQVVPKGALGHNYDPDILEPYERELRANFPECQPCPFCPPYNLPLDTIIPEPHS